MFHAEPELDKLSEINDRRFGYEEKIKKIYSIFKNNKWEDYRSLQQDIRDMYSTFDTFKKTYWKIFSPKNGFVWKDYMQLGREQPILNFISEIQITSIKDQIINVENEERKFLAIFNVVKEFVEKKDAERKNDIIKLYSGCKTEYLEPNYYRNKKMYRNEPSINNKFLDKSQAKGGIPVYKCPKCNNNYFSEGAFEKHKKICF